MLRNPHPVKDHGMAARISPLRPRGRGESGAGAGLGGWCAVVGDAGPDIGVARRAGIPVIGVSFGYSEMPIADLRPDRLIHHMNELPAAVESLMVQRHPI